MPKKAIPLSVRREVVRRDKGFCRYCGKPGKYKFFGSWVWKEHELDHVFPEYLGGLATVENIVLACRECNRLKGHKTLKEWGKTLKEV